MNRSTRDRGRSRSHSKSPIYYRQSRNNRNRSRSRSRSPLRSRRRDEDFSDCVERSFRIKVKEAADAKVEDYIRSEEFGSMVESLKRRERERILAEIQSEMEVEKKRLIAEAKEKILKELSFLNSIELSTTVGTDGSDKSSDADLAEAILLQNKLKMEYQQRKVFLGQQEEDARRLAQVLQNKRLEVPPV